MPNVKKDQLEQYTTGILRAVGAAAPNAELVARMLVGADLAGVGSHGVVRVKQYLDAIDSGILDPRAEPAVQTDAPAYAGVNGNRSFGQVSAAYAMKIAIEKANTAGVSIVGCCNVNHVGRLAEYMQMAAEQGLIAVAFCNGGGPNVAAFGARQRVFGTNPIACGVPDGRGDQHIMDFTSAATAEGKVRVARMKGEQLPPGQIIDRNGNPSSDPEDFYSGGSVVPIGGLKGSALSVVVEVLGGILTGARCSVFDDYVDGNGLLFLAFKPDLFRSQEDFYEDLSLFHQKVTGAERADGFDRILFPGELEAENREKSLKEGVNLPDTTWEMLSEIGDSLHVSTKH